MYPLRGISHEPSLNPALGVPQVWTPWGLCGSMSPTMTSNGLPSPRFLRGAATLGRSQKGVSIATAIMSVVYRLQNTSFPTDSWHRVLIDDYLNRGVVHLYIVRVEIA